MKAALQLEHRAIRCILPSSLLPGALLLLSVLVLEAVAQPVLGDVILYTSPANFSLDPFPDLPADFGPEVPDEGIEGALRLADPEDACSVFSFTDFESRWVALINRAQQPHVGNCTFDIKVHNAELAGAIAAIVYDDTYEPLIIMSKPRGRADPGIPAVFVSQKAGTIMRKLLTPGQTYVRILPVSAVAWMSLVMSAFLGFLALTVVVATFYVMRSWSNWLGHTRTRRLPGDLGYALLPGNDEGMPAAAIRALPIIVYESSSAGVAEAGQQRWKGRGAAAAASAAAACLGGSSKGSSGGSRVSPSPFSAAAEAAGDVEQGLAGPGAPGDVAPNGQQELLCGSSPKWSTQSDTSDESEGSGEGVPIGPRGGATRRLCVVCLERYTHGEKVRVLPCQHRFHVGCVDPWLATRRFCPVCKHNATQPLLAPGGGADGASGSGAPAPQPRTWLFPGGRRYWLHLGARLRTGSLDTATAAANNAQASQPRARLVTRNVVDEMLGELGGGSGGGGSGGELAAAASAPLPIPQLTPAHSEASSSSLPASSLRAPATSAGGAAQAGSAGRLGGSAGGGVGRGAAGTQASEAMQQQQAVPPRQHRRGRGRLTPSRAAAVQHAAATDVFGDMA